MLKRTAIGCPVLHPELATSYREAATSFTERLSSSQMRKPRALLLSIVVGTFGFSEHISMGSLVVVCARIPDSGFRWVPISRVRMI